MENGKLCVDIRIGVGGPDEIYVFDYFFNRGIRRGSL
jgi:hypothetical protein